MGKQEAETEATTPVAEAVSPVAEALQAVAAEGLGVSKPAETTFAALAAARVGQPDDYVCADPLRMDNVDYAIGDWIPAEAFAKNGELQRLLKDGVVKFRYQMAPPEEIRAESEAIQEELARLRGLLLEQGIDPNKL